MGLNLAHEATRILQGKDTLALYNEGRGAVQTSARAGEQMQQNLRTIGEGLAALAKVSQFRQQLGGLLENRGNTNGKP